MYVCMHSFMFVFMCVCMYVENRLTQGNHVSLYVCMYVYMEKTYLFKETMHV